MLKNNRISYIVLVVLTIILGILSRNVTGISTCIGDILYAVMVYFGMRFLLLKHNQITTVSLALLFCYGIEFLQLYKAEWMVSLRKTILGHYVLGQGFLWSDLGFYTIGVLAGYLLDLVLVKKTNE